jgi:hypothetical protein
MGWNRGSEGIAARLLKVGESTLNCKRHPSYRSSQEAQAHGELAAVRLLKEGLKQAGIGQRELEELPESGLRKVALAELIARRTTVGMGWISEALKMRSTTNVSQQIRRSRQAGKFHLEEKIEKSLPGRRKKCLRRSFIISRPQIMGFGVRPHDLPLDRPAEKEFACWVRVPRITQISRGCESAERECRSSYRYVTIINQRCQN